MPNITESLEKADILLASVQIPESRREAGSLLCFVLKKDRVFLIAHPEYELQVDEAELFDSIVKRRANREPFHHITGVKEFFGLDFVVSPDVLIPRPETEMLVARSIELLSRLDSPRFCEVGVGSGCIAVSVLHNISSTYGVGLEISEAAIGVARRNAANHDVLDRLTLLQSDVFDELDQERFDLIVSNPPYIPAKDIAGLQPEVKDFEPQTALTDGGSGLSVIEKIVRRSPTFLTPGGLLLLEIGINQSAAITEMFNPKVWDEIRTVPDFHGIPRMVCAVLI